MGIFVFTHVLAGKPGRTHSVFCVFFIPSTVISLNNIFILTNMIMNSKAQGEECSSCCCYNLTVLYCDFSMVLKSEVLVGEDFIILLSSPSS